MATDKGRKLFEKTKKRPAPPLTHVVRDNSERLEVGLSNVLRQSVGIVLEVAQQVGGATLGFLDLLPVLLVAGIQYRAAGSHQVLRKKITLVTEYVGLESTKRATMLKHG